jgi:hypothetical protein
MQRDLDGDGTFETKDSTNVTTTLQKPGLAYIYYTIPQIGKTIYSIPLRVTPSNVPVCTVSTSKTDGLSYNTTIGFIGAPPTVTDYTITVLDKASNRSITTRKETRNKFTHTFINPGNYAFGVTYITADGKQGSCESPSIQVAMSTYTVIPVFRKIKNDAWTVVDGSGMIAYKNDTLYINKLPTTLQLSVKNITPVVDKSNILVSLDGKPLAPKKDTLYEFTITSRDTTKITIQINDPIEPYTLTVPITIAAQKSR